MKQVYTVLFTFIICLFSYSGVHAQNSNIKGKVFDAVSKEGIDGATIMVKGSAQGTASDASGAFSLQAAGKMELIISAMGHESKTLVVTGGPVSVALAPSDNRLQ